jgi:amino acid transporter
MNPEKEALISMTPEETGLTPGRAEFEATPDAAEEKRKLQKHVGRADLFFFLICALVGLETIGSVAKAGAQGFTWLVFLGVAFFVPYGLLTAELGSAFPEEGGPYIWTRMAFGRFTAALCVFIYWISNPIWMGGSLTITAVAAIATFFGPLSDPAKYLISLLLIWLTVASTVLSLRIGKWVATVGAWRKKRVESNNQQVTHKKSKKR